MRKILFILSAAFVMQITTSQSLSATPILVTKSNIVPTKNDPDPTKVKAAVEQFKTLSHHEKKMKLKEINKQVRDYKKEKRSGRDDGSGVSQLLLIIIAILLPPLAVALHEGGINSRFWIDLLLTLLFYLPGLIYALVIILGDN